MTASLAYSNLGPKALSYSRLMDVNGCPRRFQIANILGYQGDDPNENVDFAYGHAVAEGIQHLILDPQDLNGALLKCFTSWRLPFWVENPKKKKNVWFALHMVHEFHKLVRSPYGNPFANFELAFFIKDGKQVPAVELTFLLELPKGYTYEGHIDVVLREKGTTNYVVLELKTTGFTNLSQAMYCNSIQALGYAIVLDQIAQESKQVSAYSVFYWVVKAGALAFESFTFPKTINERIKFLNTLIVEIEILELYRELDYYPAHGQSCYDFFRDCKYLPTCKMSDDTLRKLAKPKPAFTQAPVPPDFVFTFEQIKQTQMNLSKQTIIPTVQN